MLECLAGVGLCNFSTMPELMLPGQTGLLLPTKLLPKIEMPSGTKASTAPTTSAAAAVAAGLASDYTWSMIIVTMACAIMVVVSAMKGVRRFSFALTYTNLWYMFGKRGRLRVRVHSFTSTNGSNCFVTTSGEFSAEIVKEEELEKQLDLDFDREPNVGKGPSAGRAGCIVGTEMVFIYNDRTSVFTAGSLARFPRRKSYRDALCTPVNAPRFSSSSSKREWSSRRTRSVTVAGELPEWQLGAIREKKHKDEPSCNRSMTLIPDWASSLLEPLEIAGSHSTSFALFANSLGSSSPVRSEYPWDSVLKLRLAGAEEGRRPILTRNEESVYPSAVDSGVAQTVTLKDNVVKLWDNPTRRSVATLGVSKSNSSVSTLDVDWEKEVGAFGTSIGDLSLWDLERAKCVTSIRAHDCGISSVHFNAADKSGRDAWVMTAGRSADESGLSCVSLWDSRALNAAPAAMRGVGRFSTIDDFRFQDNVLVARENDSRIAVYDIRMSNSSSVFLVSAGEVRSGGCKGGAQVRQFGKEDQKLWDVSAVDEETSEGDADFEDDWGIVDEEETVKSPSMLSRCFIALSSAISR